MSSNSSCGNNITLPIGPRGPQGPAGPPGTAGTPGAPGADGADGVSIEWLGTLTTAPLTPTLNQGYYNSTDKKSYIWDGDSWEIIAQDGAQGIQGIQGPPGSGASADIQEEGVTVNTAAVTTINFEGAGATATETSPGVVKVTIPGAVGGGGVTHIDGPDAVSVLGEDGFGLPNGTIENTDDTPNANLPIKGASDATDGFRFATLFPSAKADTYTLLEENNSSGVNKKYMMMVNMTIEYDEAGTFPNRGNLRIYSAIGSGASLAYKPGSAQYINYTVIYGKMCKVISFVDVIEVPNGSDAMVCMDQPGVVKSNTAGIATVSGGAVRIVALNTNIIQLD